jgi:hypothetical protein
MPALTPASPLLIALIENPDEDTAKLITLLPDAQEVAAAVIDAMPNDEHA